MKNDFKLKMSYYLKNIKVFYFILVLMTTLHFACEKKLSSSGEVSKEPEIKYLKQNSLISLFSYSKKYPVAITVLPTANSDEFNTQFKIDDLGLIIINNYFLKPIIDPDTFEPINPIAAEDRSNQKKAVSLDLFIKVYNANAEHFYLEAPVLGKKVNPTPISTALSWILRWSFENKTIKISQLKYNEILETVKTICLDCNSKTTSEIVEFILNNNHLSKLIINTINLENKATTPSIQVQELKYTPPSFDYVWSSKSISDQWEFILTHDEPVIENTKEKIFFDLILVDPKKSNSPLKPHSWSHKSTEEFNIKSTQFIELTSIQNTPLIYELDNNSSGIHVFESTFENESSIKIKVISTVNDKTRLPKCQNSEILQIRANKILTTHLNKNLKPDYSPAQAAQRLSTQNIAIDSIQNIPTLYNARNYTIKFTNNGTNKQFSITKVVSGSTVVQTLSESNIFISGQKIIFLDDETQFTMSVVGLPENNDEMSFQFPYDSSNTNFLDNLGCYELDSRKEDSKLQYSLIDPKLGQSITSDGVFTWVTKTNDYNANSSLTHPTSKITVQVFNTESKVSDKFTLSVLVQEDKIPQFCNIARLSNENGELSNGESPLISISQTVNSIISNFQVCDPQGATPTRTPIASNSHLNSGYLKELTTLGQTLYFSDEEGDPFSVKLEKAPDATYPATTHSLTSWNTIEPNNTTFTEVSSDEKLKTFLWNFKASTGQVNIPNLNTALKYQFKITYLGSNVNTEPVVIYPFVVHIDNTFDNPISDINTELSYTGFNANNVYYRTLDPTNNNQYLQGDLSISNLINTSTGTLLTNTNILSQIYPLKEGQIGIIQLPIHARLPGLNSNNSLLYEVLTTTATATANEPETISCQFASPGRVYLKRERCVLQDDLSNSQTETCLRVFLNYNIATESQDPIPYNASTRTNSNSCEMTIKAYNKDVPSTPIQIAKFKLYIQNVETGHPYLTRLPPTPTYLDDITNNSSNYPTEGKAHNIRHLLNKLISNRSVGPLETSLPTASTIQATGTTPLACSVNGVSTNCQSLVLQEFNASKWNLHPNRDTTLYVKTTQLSQQKNIYLESADADAEQGLTSTSAFTRITNLRQEHSGLVIILNNITAETYFEKATYNLANSQFTWAPLSVIDTATGNSITSTQSSGQFSVTTNDNSISKIRVRTLSSNGAAPTGEAIVFSNFILTSQVSNSQIQNAEGFEIINFSITKDPFINSSSSNRFTFNSYKRVPNSVMSVSSNYIVSIKPQQILRSIISTTTTFNNATKPQISFNTEISNNKNENISNGNWSFRLKCYYQKRSNPAISGDCSHSTQGIGLTLNNIKNDTTAINWTPPFYLGAIDPDFSATSVPPDSDYEITFRAYGYGGFGFNNDTSLSSTNCSNTLLNNIPALNSPSCVQLKFFTRIKEDIQLPLTSVFISDTTGSNTLNATAKETTSISKTELGKSSGPPYGIAVKISKSTNFTTATIPTAFFKIQITPASNHPIDVPSYFRIFTDKTEINNGVTLTGINANGDTINVFSSDSSSNPMTINHNFNGQNAIELNFKLTRNSTNLPPNADLLKQIITFTVIFFNSNDQPIQDEGGTNRKHTIQIRPSYE